MVHDGLVYIEFVSLFHSVDNAYFAKIDISIKVTFFFSRILTISRKSMVKTDEKRIDSSTSTTNTRIKKRERKKEERKMEGKKCTRIA